MPIKDVEFVNSISVMEIFIRERPTQQFKVMVSS